MKNSTMNKVLIALDYNPTAQKIAEVGFSLAKGMGANIYLLHVVSDQAAYSPVSYDPIMGYSGYIGVDVMQPNYMDELKKSSLDFLNKTKEHLGDPNIQTIVKVGDYSEMILEAATEIKVDIVIMGSHSRKWLEKILMGSTTENVLHSISIPLLIVPTGKKK